MKKIKVAITGSRGFVGSHLVEVLGQDFEVFGWDVKDKRDIFNLDDVFGVDVVVHLAALTNVQESGLQPSRYFWTNVMGTAHVLERCVQARTRLIYLSSAAAAAPSSSVYAYTKWMAEQLVEQMQQAVDGVILRPENIYGRGMNRESIFSRFLHNDNLTVYGTGEHGRDFIHVSDVVAIIRFAIESQWRNTKVDIGTGKMTTVNEIAALFAEKTGKKIIHLPAVKEVEYSKANTKKLKALYPFPLRTDIKKDIATLIAENN